MRATNKFIRQNSRAGGLLHEYASLAPRERVALLRTGLSTEIVDELAEAMGVSKSTLCGWLNLPTRTAQRPSMRLPLRASERLLGLIRLIAEVEQIVNQSGDSRGFYAARWMSDWLNRPHPALGGDIPMEYLDLSEGRELLNDLLRQLQSGVYV